MNEALAKYLDENISEDNITLDIGCGIGPYSERIKGILTTVDIWPGAKSDFVLDAGLESLPFCNCTFDMVLMFDVIEHMSRDEGLYALAEAKRVASGKVAVLTPLFWTSNLQNVVEGPYKGNMHNMHQSQWSKEDFDGFTEKPMIDGYFFGEWYK